MIMFEAMNSLNEVNIVRTARVVHVGSLEVARYGLLWWGGVCAL
jgi:hypothetical protein